MKRYWYKYSFHARNGIVGNGMCAIKGEGYITKSSMSKLAKIVEKDNSVQGVVITSVQRVG